VTVEEILRSVRSCHYEPATMQTSCDR